MVHTWHTYDAQSAHLLHDHLHKTLRQNRTYYAQKDILHFLLCIMCFSASSGGDIEDVKQQVGLYDKQKYFGSLRKGELPNGQEIHKRLVMLANLGYLRQDGRFWYVNWEVVNQITGRGTSTQEMPIVNFDPQADLEDEIGDAVYASFNDWDNNSQALLLTHIKARLERAGDEGLLNTDLITLIGPTTLSTHSLGRRMGNLIRDGLLTDVYTLSHHYSTHPVTGERGVFQIRWWANGYGPSVNESHSWRKVWEKAIAAAAAAPVRVHPELTDAVVGIAGDDTGQIPMDLPQFIYLSYMGIFIPRSEISVLLPGEQEYRPLERWLGPDVCINLGTAGDLQSISLNQYRTNQPFSQEVVGVRIGDDYEYTFKPGIQLWFGGCSDDVYTQYIQSLRGDS